MKTNKIINLLTYYIIFTWDENIKSDISYIVEKYYRIFNEKPNNINCKDFYLSIKDKFDDAVDFNRYMDRWNITVDDKDFDIYFFTYYLVTSSILILKEDGYYLDLDRSDKIHRLNKIIKIYKQFFKDFNSIDNYNNRDIAHQILRDEVDKYIIENNRLFSLLKIKENILNKTK